jgi:hypothetical protein
MADTCRFVRAVLSHRRLTLSTAVPGERFPFAIGLVLR